MCTCVRAFQFYIYREYLFLTDEQGEVIGKRDLLVFKYLVENKADPQAKTDLGYTPLHKASIHPSLNIIKYLVEEKLVGIQLTNIL